MEVQPGAFVPVVAIAYPREHAEALPGYADKRKVAPVRADDAVVAAYTRSLRCGALATIPSLVEHLDGETSLMGYQRGAGRPHRRAALFQTSET
jgi:hypothetical protein